MDNLAYTSAAAMTFQRIERQVVANELANVSTVGFKRSFDTAQGALKVTGPGFDSRFIPQVYSDDVVDLSPGARILTGRPLDVAMNDQTVLGVESSRGDLAFTRRGDLRVSAEGVLETGAGHAVLGQAGPITIPQGFAVSIVEDGSIFARDPQNPGEEAVLVDQLLLRDASGVQLGRREDGLFALSRRDGRGLELGGDLPPGPNVASVSSGVLEGSNASAVSAMVYMLELSRMFELQIRQVSQASSLVERGSSMMRHS
jgi:flagellar basal-body rod protein FlgF